MPVHRDISRSLGLDLAAIIGPLDSGRFFIFGLMNKNVSELVLDGSLNFLKENGSLNIGKVICETSPLERDKVWEESGGMGFEISKGSNKIYIEWESKI